MAKTVDTKEYLDMICGLLAEGNTSVPVPVAGSSMSPFLYHGDMVYLDRPEGKLKKGDIVLYTRPSGQYILHRIVRVNADGSFIMLGDAQTDRERIKSEAQIHGRVTRVLHRGKALGPESLWWKFFATVWIWVWPWRRQIIGLVSRLKMN